MRHPIKIAAALGAATLLIAGCGKPSSSTATNEPSSPGTSSAATGSLKACMVLDTGGVDDHSFNQSSWAGLQAANKANPNIKISYVSSSSDNDYIPNLTAETNKGCGTVIAVGGLMADAVKKTAKKNPTSSTPRSTLRRVAPTSTACSTTPPRAASSVATSRRA